MTGISSQCLAKINLHSRGMRFIAADDNTA